MAPREGAGGQYPEQIVRLTEFRDENPGVDVGRGKVDGWDAAIPLQGDSLRCLHRGDLGTLLDDAETILAGGDARARPG
jgi:hypothetical protein